MNKPGRFVNIGTFLPSNDGLTWEAVPPDKTFKRSFATKQEAIEYLEKYRTWLEPLARIR